MNITLGSGKAVHYVANPTEGYCPTPDCGGNRAAERYTETAHAVTCKKCLKIMAAATPEPEAEPEEETMPESPETRAVMEELQRTAPGSLSQPVGETFPMVSEATYAAAARSWLRDRSELSEQQISGADYRVPFEWFGGQRVNYTVDTAAETRYSGAPGTEPGNDKGEIMADNKATETEIIVDDLADALADAPESEQSPEDKALEQIRANIERAASLAEADNVDGLKELNRETEAAISSLPTRGKRDGKTWTAIRKELRDSFRAAAQVNAETKAVAAKPAAAAPAPQAKDYSVFAGVSELVAKGTSEVVDAVKDAHRTTAAALKIAETLFDVRRRITKDGVPDLTGDSQAARNAAKVVFENAAKALEGKGSDFENGKAIAALKLASRYRMSDVRVSYIRKLSTPEGADEWKAHFAKVAEAHPELDPAEAVFKFYDIDPLSRREREIAKKQPKELPAPAREAIESGAAEVEESGEGAPEPTAQDKVKADISKVEAAIKSAISHAKALSDEDKAAVKAKIMELMALAAQL